MSPRRSANLTLEHVLLALLDQKSMHGYELYQELREMKGISLIWNIKQPLLYAILDKLERRGFLLSEVIVGETYPPRKRFHLTDAGKNSLQTWLKSPVRRARDLRQEFLAKLIVARRYGRANAVELIHVQERACQSWFEDLQGHAPVPGGERMDEWIVHSFRLNRVKGVLAWLKACEAELEK